MQVCLGPQGLAEHWSSIYSKDLRESIRLQISCLENPETYPNHQPVCQQWVKCLKAANFKADFEAAKTEKTSLFEEVKKGLIARGAKDAPHLPHLGGNKAQQDLQLLDYQVNLGPEVATPCQLMPCPQVSLHIFVRKSVLA